MLTARENLFRVLRGEPPAWVPIAGHADPFSRPSLVGMDPALAASFRDIAWCDETSVKFSRHLGLDIMDWYAVPVGIRRRSVSVERRVEGDVTTIVWHTPKGELRETIRVCRDPTGAVSSNWTEHPVKGPEDIPALAAIFEDEVIEPDEPALERTRRRRQLIGDGGLILGSMDGTPSGMMVRVYAGVAVLAYLWADAPEALRDLFAVMEANYRRRLAVAVRSDIDVIVSVDDTSTTAISPAMFEAFNMEVTDERARLAHEAGKFYFHHSCGHIRDLLPLYRRTAMDAVHAFTVPPLGNVTFREGRRLLGDRIAIMGGVEGELFGVSPDDRDEVRKRVMQTVRDAAPWRRFIFGIGGDPHRTMEQTRFIVDCCREALGKEP